MKPANLTERAESRDRRVLGHDSRQLEVWFHQTFFADCQTVLQGGAPEPLYLPAVAGQPARIFYRDDFFRSALHEVAHWCVAGQARRQREDYGYWYAPDGRSAAQQVEFERVEVLPQAYELLFCAAADHRFQVSADNLSGQPGDGADFARAVRTRAQSLLSERAGQRWDRWLRCLEHHYRGGTFITMPDLERVNP